MHYTFSRNTSDNIVDILCDGKSKLTLNYHISPVSNCQVGSCNNFQVVERILKPLLSFDQCDLIKRLLLHLKGTIGKNILTITITEDMYNTYLHHLKEFEVQNITYGIKNNKKLFIMYNLHELSKTIK